MNAQTSKFSLATGIFRFYRSVWNHPLPKWDREARVTLRSCRPAVTYSQTLDGSFTAREVAVGADFCVVTGWTVDAGIMDVCKWHCDEVARTLPAPNHITFKPLLTVIRKTRWKNYEKTTNAHTMRYERERLKCQLNLSYGNNIRKIRRRTKNTRMWGNAQRDGRTAEYR